MAAVPNILDGIERDPKGKLLVAFLEQVLHVERNDIRDILITEAHQVPFLQPETYWNASVTLGNRQIDILISNSCSAWSIESVVFRGGWQG